MHAYLIIGRDKELINKELDKLTKSFGAKVIENQIIKIDDVRNLNNFLRLSIQEPTIIFCQNIEEAGIEALNAFLKNLEEPQDNLYFVLTATSIKKILPTIVSRCLVIQTQNSKNEIRNEDSEKFLKMTTGDKFKEIDKIKDRGIALDFVGNLIDTHHWQMHNQDLDLEKIAKNLETEIKILNNLKANGNVGLQLTNLVVKLI